MVIFCWFMILLKVNKYLLDDVLSLVVINMEKFFGNLFLYRLESGMYKLVLLFIM